MENIISLSLISVFLLGYTYADQIGAGYYNYPNYGYEYKYEDPSSYEKPPGADTYLNYGSQAAVSSNYAAPSDNYDIHINMNSLEAKSGPEERSGYDHKPKTKYVPVVVKKKKKKQKVISVSKGTFIPGGVQVFGKFKSLKSCMKACGATPNCFAGDYNPWTGKCYFHTNTTACNSMSSHSKITHFKKVPCTVTDAPRGLILLGTQLFGSVEQKGIKDLPSCLKKCATLGPGISPSPTDLTGPLFGDHQLCFGINYDFATHKCYFIINNHPRIEMTDALAAYSICPIEDDTPVRRPIDLQPNPTVVTILLCPAVN